MSDQDKKDHNAIIEALKKQPHQLKTKVVGTSQKTNKTKSDAKIGLIAARINAQKQEAYLLGVQMGQENVFEHLMYGPCSSDCPLTVALADVLTKDTYRHFKPFRNPEEPK